MSEQMRGQLDVRVAERPEETTAPLPAITSEPFVEYPSNRRSKARWAVIGLFAVAIVLAVAIPLVGNLTDQPAKPTHSHSASKTTTKHHKKGAGNVDAIDPHRTTVADEQELHAKLISGGIAFVLVVAVVGGRRLRKYNKKKREGAMAD